MILVSGVQNVEHLKFLSWFFLLKGRNRKK